MRSEESEEQEDVDLRILKVLLLDIRERIIKMAQGQAELDAALALLATALQAVQDAIKNHVPGTAVDLTNEVTAINNAAATLQQVATQIAAL